MRILVIEDDADLAEVMALGLRNESYAVDVASTCAEAEERLRATEFDVACVDLGLPDGSGMNMVREASSRGRVGVIVVSGRGDEVDRVVGLEVGADDYISKPFSSREVTARVRALYRRLGPDASQYGAMRSPPRSPDIRGVLQVGEVTLDPGRMRLIGVEGVPVRLTGAEADLLARLIAAGAGAISREAVAEQVLGHRLLPQQRGIDQLASSLRQKIQAISSGAIRILAVRGKGYRLVY